jgi:cell division transport system permease protein
MQAPFVLSEVGIGLRRNLTMTVAVVVTVAVSLSFVGLALLLRQEASVNKDYWYDKVEVSIFLCSDGSKEPGCAAGGVTQAQRDAVHAELRALPQVEEVYYESKQEAYDRSKDLPALRALTSTVTPDQMPESYRVKLKDPTSSDVVMEAFSGRAGIDQVIDQRRLLAPLFNLLAKMQAITFGFALLQLLAAGLMIMNTIRLASFSRRRETGIMRLVGASNLSIQLPFLLEGVLAGLLGGLLAGGAVAAGYRLLVVDWLQIELPFFRYVGWGEVLFVLLLLMILGVGLAAAASYLTLRKYLRV